MKTDYFTKLRRYLDVMDTNSDDSGKVVYASRQVKMILDSMKKDPKVPHEVIEFYEEKYMRLGE